VVFMVLVGWLTRARTELRWAALKRLTHHFADVLDGLVVLKVFGRSARQAEGLSDVGERHRRETMGALRLAFLSSFVLELCATISVALVAVGVGLRVLDGSMALQTGLFVLLLAPEAFLPVRQVGVHFHDSAEGAEAARDAFALLEAARPRLDLSLTGSNLLDLSLTGTNLLDLSLTGTNLLERGLTDANDRAHGPRIEVRGLRVRYLDRDTDALPPTDLVVEAGEVVALGGPSGCGKSTLLMVLLGFVEPTAGTITVDGVAVADSKALRDRIAWVPQHPTLLAGTIADNVRLTTPAADVDVRAGLDAAAAGGIALDRPVGERGANLSAGECRRVAMARALLRVRGAGADLLLLDEPTAGLDAAAEAAMIEAIRSAGVSALVVAHRPALLAAADRVVGVGRQTVPA
ncbi:MAG: ABC transporter ATP-binding protein/permease, partial [Nocardioidaceae bacterium]